jgi:hypothetical protein
VIDESIAVIRACIPVNVCGNSVAVLGISRAGCRGGASSGLYHHGYHHHWVS